MGVGTQIDHSALIREDEDDSENPLGALEKADIDLKHLEVSPVESRGEQTFIFALRDKMNPVNSLEVGAESQEVMLDWIENIQLAVKELEARFLFFYLFACLLNLFIVFFNMHSSNTCGT